MRYKYIGFDGIEVLSHLVNKMKFNGYTVVYQPSGCLWRITEIVNSEETGLSIKFWPSKKNNCINSIQYKPSGLNMWYNPAGICTEIYCTDKDLKYGESILPMNIKKYFYKGEDVTDEVLNITENREVMTTEDKFNLFIKYGSCFKFYDEYCYHVNLDDIIKLCSKK